MIKLIIFLVFNFLALARADTLPNNPCPEFFKYEIVALKVTGLVTIPFDGLPIHLEVEASMRGIYTRHKSVTSIELLTDTDELLFGTAKSVRYRINFPVQKSIPQLTLIKVNGTEICDGPNLVPSDLICTTTKLKFTHNYPSNSTKRRKRQEYAPGLLELMPEGSEYFYPLICADYDLYDEEEEKHVPAKEEKYDDDDDEYDEYDEDDEDDEEEDESASQSEKDGEGSLTELKEQIEP